MIKPRTNMSCLGAMMVAGALLAACGGGAAGGPSGAEFVAACLQEGQSPASQMLDQETFTSADTAEVGDFFGVAVK